MQAEPTSLQHCGVTCMTAACMTIPVSKCKRQLFISTCANRCQQCPDSASHCQSLLAVYRQPLPASHHLQDDHGDVLHQGNMEWAVKVLERMENQNTFKELAMDFKVPKLVHLHLT